MRRHQRNRIPDAGWLSVYHFELYKTALNNKHETCQHFQILFLTSPVGGRCWAALGSPARPHRHAVPAPPGLKCWKCLFIVHFSYYKNKTSGLPWWAVVKNPSASAGTQVQFLVWNVPHAAGQLSPHAPGLLRLWGPRCATRGAAARSPRSTTRDGPRKSRGPAQPRTSVLFFK